MGIETAVLTAGLAATAIGTGVQYAGQKRTTSALKRAERAREKQQGLEASRARRQAVRQSIIQRSLSLVTAANQGAAIGSSGVQGGQAGITATAGRDIQAVNQNEQIGSDIFAANRAYYSASGVTSAGQGLTSLGGALISNIGPIERLSTFTAGRT